MRASVTSSHCEAILRMEWERHSVPHPEGYQNSAALVAGIRRVADFEISVSALS